jgi:CheY-like chemotaxis protein
MLGKDYPLTKDDIHYDPDKQEVTLKREKFDALIGFVKEMLANTNAVEDERDIASYRARKAEATSSVFESLMEKVSEASGDVQAWLASPEHTILDLSQRTGIPYATCHRIVRERIGTPELEVGHLAKLAKAIGPDMAKNRIRRAPVTGDYKVVVGAPSSDWREQLLERLNATGMHVTTAEKTAEALKTAEKVSPDVMLLDVSMPWLAGENVVKWLRNRKLRSRIVILYDPQSKEQVGNMMGNIFCSPTSEIQSDKK